MRPEIAEAIDTLDAAVFVGDQFQDDDARREFRYALIAWTKEMQNITEAKEDAEKGIDT